MAEPRCHMCTNGVAGNSLKMDGEARRDMTRAPGALRAWADLALGGMHSKVMAVTAGAGGGPRAAAGVEGGGWHPAVSGTG